jgi:enoyl-CoA hydratase
VLDIEEREGTAVLRLRHGKVNALDLELVRAITGALGTVAPDRAVVLTGAGSAFSAGVDLRRIVEGGEPYVREFLPALAEMFMSVFCHPGPVLAAVNGHAIAGGCVIAAACDVRVMSQGTIGLAELSVGVPFPTEALEVLRHAVGPAAGRLVLTAELLDASAAQSVGLIHDVVSPEALPDAVLARAQSMLRTPAEVFSFTKRQWQQPTLDRIAARKDDAEAVAAMWASPRSLEAIAAYLDALGKRTGKTSR